MSKINKTLAVNLSILIICFSIAMVFYWTISHGYSYEESLRANRIQNEMRSLFFSVEERQFQVEQFQIDHYDDNIILAKRLESSRFDGSFGLFINHESKVLCYGINHSSHVIYVLPPEDRYNMIYIQAQKSREEIYTTLSKSFSPDLTISDELSKYIDYNVKKIESD